MFHCPICGKPLFGGCMNAHQCSRNAIAERERELREYDDSDDARVFSNCNVCGRKLHTSAEDKMGICEMCADE